MGQFKLTGARSHIFFKKMFLCVQIFLEVQNNQSQELVSIFLLSALVLYLKNYCA